LLRGGRTLTRLVVVWLVTAGTMLLLSGHIPGYTVRHPQDALLAAAIVGLLNAVVWPLLMRVALALTVLTLGVGAFVLNGALLLVVARLLPGLRVSTLPTAVAVAALVSAVIALTSSAVALDGDEFFHRFARWRAWRRRGGTDQRPGIVFLQIDGLSHDVIRRAVRDGDTPTLARWIAGGSHRLVRWDTDWSSQTGAGQAGILHGSSRGIPAFRWYEKDSGRLMVCSRRTDAAEIERRLSDGRGLLHAGGSSRGNLFSGDAVDVSVTMSKSLRRRGRLGQGYAGYFRDPYNAVRSLGGVITEIVRELLAAAAQRRRDVRPRVGRGGIYPLLRALATVVTRDLVTCGVLEDIVSGRPVVYANFVGYDEVAHHSGIERYDTLGVLRSIDQQIGRLARAAGLAPRPYRLVVLSDHGQSQGATFADRYGTTLDRLVRTACGAPRSAAGQQRRRSRPVGALRRSAPRPAPTVPDEHSPALSGEAGRAAQEEADAEQGLVVLSSGNLGLVYFADRPGRVTLEEIESRYPELLPTLIGHPGIGFVQVRSEQHGPVALGRRGVRYLAENRWSGVDPLAGFGRLAADQVLRADGCAYAADLMINSGYDPQTDEVAAFEPLVGSHGGLGGPQTRAFLLHPVELAAPDQPLHGPEALHTLFRGWLAGLGHASYGTPTAVPAGVGADTAVG
jgi:uncharacterized membrane protein YvlD (DUF360 family)